MSSCIKGDYDQMTTSGFALELFFEILSVNPQKV